MVILDNILAGMQGINKYLLGIGVTVTLSLLPPLTLIVLDLYSYYKLGLEIDNS